MKMFDGINGITAAGILEGLKSVPPAAIAAGRPFMRAYEALQYWVTDAVIDGTGIESAVLMVWSWIPGCVQLNPRNLDARAVRDLSTRIGDELRELQRGVRGFELGFEDFQSIADLVVEKGFSTATKVLHFCLPDYYPICDGRVRSSYSSLRYDTLSPREHYDEYIRLAKRLRGISESVSTPEFRELLQCEAGDEQLTGVRIAELGLYYIGGMK